MKGRFAEVVQPKETMIEEVDDMRVMTGIKILIVDDEKDRRGF